MLCKLFSTDCFYEFSLKNQAFLLFEKKSKDDIIPVILMESLIKNKIIVYERCL